MAGTSSDLRLNTGSTLAENVDHNSMSCASWLTVRVCSTDHELCGVLMTY